MNFANFLLLIPESMNDGTTPHEAINYWSTNKPLFILETSLFSSSHRLLFIDTIKTITKVYI